MMIERRKVLLLGFDSHSLERNRLTAFLDKDQHFLNWIGLLPGQVFIVTESAIAEVAQLIRTQFPGYYLFVTEISPLSSDGWLPPDMWQFISNPSNAKALMPPALSGWPPVLGLEKK